MTVVYIDEVFALNAAADGFLLFLTARLAGIAPRWGRYALAALLGGLYACCAALPGFWGAGAVKGAAGVALALAAFGREERLGRLTVLFFAVSCAFAGCALAMDSLADGPGLSAGLWRELWSYGGGLGLLACAALGTYGALALALRAAARKHTEAKLLSVRLCVLDRTTALTALRDSGNDLRDNGVPVLVVSPAVLDRLFPPDALRLLTPDRLRVPETLLAPLMDRFPDLRPHLVPYRAVGVSSGLLLTVACRWIEVGGVRRPGGRVALSSTELGDGFQALWGGGDEWRQDRKAVE